MTQKTALGYLIEQLRSLTHNPKTHLGMGDIRVTQGMIDEFEEQAKQMEKKQQERTSQLPNVNVDEVKPSNPQMISESFNEKRNLTAVEWLVEQLEPAIALQSKIIQEYAEKAKRMEKEQLNMARLDGINLANKGYGKK